jgi:hypothetical protein
LGIPKVAANTFDLSTIAQVSLFRSGVGHDYHDDFETCRSMKHYFLPNATVDWSTIPIYSPVAGTIVRMRIEALGTQVLIRPAAFPAFVFILFHPWPASSRCCSNARASGGCVATFVP